jgi:hypothetical protein
MSIYSAMQERCELSFLMHLRLLYQKFPLLIILLLKEKKNPNRQQASRFTLGISFISSSSDVYLQHFI